MGELPGRQAGDESKVDVALVGGHGDGSLLGGGERAEIVLAGILLQLGVDELRACQAGVDSVEGVPAERSLPTMNNVAESTLECQP